MEVWLVPIAGTRVLVPFRVSIPTPIGLGVMQATQFVSVAQPPRAGGRGRNSATGSQHGRRPIIHRSIALDEALTLAPTCESTRALTIWSRKRRSRCGANTRSCG